MKDGGEIILTKQIDPATLLDSSATVSYDPDWWTKASRGFGHDYHNLANQYHGFDVSRDKPGATDQNYRRPDTTEAAPKMKR